MADIIDTLNDLISSCRDSEEGFGKAAKGCHSDDLRSRFIGIARQRADFADDLTTHVRELGGEPAESGHFKVTGDLTLHGITRPVVLDVQGPTAEIKDPRGNTRAGAEATTRINRKDFGLVWNQALDAGGVAVGDEVAITIDVEATKRAAVGSEASVRQVSTGEKK